MRIISSDNNVSVFIIEQIDKENINSYLKKLILTLKRCYKIDIFGFYKANIYINKKVGTIIELVKDDDFDLFNDLIDLDINIIENADIWLKFKDYFLDKKESIYIYEDSYYINIDDISKHKLLRVIEFCSIVYGEELEKIKCKISTYN